MAVAFIDTNVFIHAQTRDAYSEECIAFLERVERGDIQVRLDALVLHELSYALPRYRREMSRREVADYLLTILTWDGIVTDSDLLDSAVMRWRDDIRLGFVDAYLAASAAV